MIYQFNKTEVDLEQFHIHENGQPLPIEPKVFDLIVYLIEHRERLVSRDELLEQVWNNRQVSDTTLSNHIKSARKVLGDTADTQEVIKTVRSRGYQFVANVVQVDKAKATQASIDVVEMPNFLTLRAKQKISSEQSFVLSNISKLWLAIVGVLLVLICGIWLVQPFLQSAKPKAVPTLLIVPFSVSSEDPDKWQPFADQVSRELMQGFRKVSGIDTVAPPSSFSFKYNKVREHIRQQLPKVNYVLDGVVAQGDNDKFRIIIELEDLRTGKLVWDRDFDIELSNTNRFSLQSDVAKQVTQALKVVMLEQEKRQLNQVPTLNLAAYDLYVLGQHQLSLISHQSVQRSIHYFDQAIALDAKFEQAYFAKSKAYRVLMTIFERPKDVLPQVVSSAKAVLNINPDSAQVMSMLGLAYVHSWQWPEALEMLSAAQTRNPNIAMTELGFALYYSAMGNQKGVKLALAKAAELDPLNEEIADWGTWALMMSNQIPEAIKWGQEQTRLHPNNPYPMLALSIAYYINGNYELATRLGQKSVELAERAPYPLVVLAQIYAAQGNKENALGLVTEAINQNVYTCPYEMAVVHALLDNPDTMFNQLNKAIDYRSNCLIFTRNDPRLDNYKTDDRYEAILQQVGLDNHSIQQYSQ